MKKVYELDFRGRKLTVEIGELAKQAHGAVLVRYGDTVILSTAVVSKNANILSDFFPLMVLYQEKLYSVGKIPGGFIKREGRPTDNATLAARMIDRPMRPMFPHNFRNEVQIVNTVLSVDQDNSPELAAMFGSSLATSISKIPFDGPIAGVKVGRVNGEFIINPTAEQLELTDIELTVAGTKEAINMVESGSKEVSEEDMLEALMFGHDAVKELCVFQEKIIAEVGQPKMEYEVLEITDELKNEVRSLSEEKLNTAMRILDKIEKYEAIDKVKEEVVAKYEEENANLKDDELKELITKVKLVLEEIEYEIFRQIVVKEKTRADGRAMDEIRPLSTDIDLLPRTHGSALFTRGQTQALGVVTLGALGEHQILDGLSLEAEKRFMLHYNFPQFSVGETGRYGAPGRREIGHGALAERALEPLIPSEEEFPYTIRLVSEVLSSNGSTSQASVCGSTLALLDAGVPIKRPAAGIAMGLITSEDLVHEEVLTDIQGIEDFFGDMDFKVAGTTEGITSIQVDTKIKGLSFDVISKAITDARKARVYILDKIEECIPESRKEVSKFAPKTCTISIDPEKIRDVIGAGGKVINKIIADTGVKIDIKEDGTVFVSSPDHEGVNEAIRIIEGLTKEVQVGEVYLGKVTKIAAFGAFVEILPNKEGLCHISKLDKARVNKVEDVVSVGDEILVKVTEIDQQGRINLSRKDALPAEEETTEQ